MLPEVFASGAFAPSPLEQFTIVSILPLHIGNFYFSITNSTVFIGLSVGAFLFFVRQSFLLGGGSAHPVSRIRAAAVENSSDSYSAASSTTFKGSAEGGGGKVLPTVWQSAFEMMYDFVRSLLHEQVGDKGKRYFPMVFCLFSFLLCTNLMGMIPYAFTATSHLIVTFSLSFMVFLAVTLIGFQTHGLHFFSFFLPPGAPLALSPFLVLIELISYAFRGISLGVRLFANMMAGHALLKILSGFAWTLLTLGGVLAPIGGLGVFLVVFALTFLEVGVACLQAYVFTILTCIYLSDAIHLH